MKLIRNLSCTFLVFAGLGLAQPAINEVVNAGSRIASGFPSYGIAQGAIFTVTGTGVGVDPLLQATFPLPTTDGLGGVTVQATVGGTTVDCILVYVSANEVAAILPSSTPLGTGTATVNNNGTTLTGPITVVDAAFGAFTQSRTGSGPALAANVGDDGSTTANSLTQPARIGQAIKLNGTGLGAISSDETQSGAADVPGATPIVWVGSTQATVVSSGRAACCTGLDPTFPVPQGVAGWDVIQFVVPDGVSGCHVPVAVQTGKFVSNFTTIAVAASGACTDPNGFSGGTLQDITGGSLRVGGISLTRSAIKVTAQGLTITTNSDAGGATFIQYDLSSVQSAANAFFNVTALGGCLVTTSKSGGQIPTFTLPYTVLDAGSAINVKGPNGTKPMAKGDGGFYSANFGTSTVLPSIPGLPPGGFPGAPGSTPPFLDAGAYTSDNGGGGADVKGFTANLTVPASMTWTNQDQITAVTQSQGVTVTWTGGDPSSVINIIGSSSNKVGAATISGTFICTAPVSAGTFTVPSIVTLSLPPSQAIAGSPTGILGVQSTKTGPFTAPGIDIGTISSSVLAFKNVAYQ